MGTNVPQVAAEAASFDSSACAVEAFGVARVPVAGIAALRKMLGPSPVLRIAPSLLKHADAQTLLSLAAVLDALDRAGWRDRSFETWGIIGAPRFIGRSLLAAALERFQELGPLSVSPLLTATISLHAVAGSLSLALQAHGFHFGVGGGPGHLSEGLMAGLAARYEGAVPGIWVVATGFDPEPIPDNAGNNTTEATGYAVALALNATAEPAGTRLNLRLVGPTALGAAPEEPALLDAHGCPALHDLVSLAEFLRPLEAEVARSAGRPRRWHLALPEGGGTLVLDDDTARAVAPNPDASPAARAG